MAGVEKKIVAVQVFLRSIQAFETFAEVRQKHVLDLSKTIEKTTFDVAQSGKLLDVIDGQVWGPLCEELKSLVVSRHLVPGKERKGTQDYTTLPQHIPEALWRSIMNVSGSVALEKLCAHSVLLGLRHPTEWTTAMLLCLSFDRQGTLMESEQYSLMRQHRERIKKFLAKPDPSVDLAQLPADPRDLPKSLFEAAFPDNVRPEPHSSFGMWLERTKAWPLRSTNMLASNPLASKEPARHAGDDARDGSFSMGKFMAGMLQGLHRERAEAAASSCGDAAGAVNLQIFSVRDNNTGRQESKPPAQAQLALTNGEQDGPTQRTAPADILHEALPTRRAAAAGSQAVAETLQALREAVPTNESVAEAKKGKGKGKPQKKPAAVLKRPAGSSENLDLPNRSVVSAGDSDRRSRGTKRSASGPASGSPGQLRLRLLESIPKKIRDRWKDGCARCRYRSYCTISCWKSRGWDAPAP